MTKRPFYADATAMYVREFEGELPGDEPSSFEAAAESGTVTLKHSFRRYEKEPEDEIAIEHPTDEPGVLRKVTVYRDIRPHLEHPVPKIAMTKDSRYAEDGRFLGSVERLATLEETAIALTMARDLFKADAFEARPLGPGQR